MTIRSITPQLRTTDLAKTLHFYTEVLGLIETFRFQDFYAGVATGTGAGTQEIHLKQVEERDASIDAVRRDGHLHVYFDVPDVNAFASRLVAAGVVLVQPPHETAWGTREVVFEDDQGHTLYAGKSLS